jgi:hypothetical protein
MHERAPEAVVSVVVYRQPKNQDADVPPRMAERERPVSWENRIVVVTSVLLLRRSGYVVLNAASKQKGTGVFSRRA